jgi:hypothetical protein
LLQLQVEHDKLLREWPDEHFSYYAVQRAADDDEVYRFLARKKKEHLAAWQKLQLLFAQNRKDSPVNPPEPVDITADSNLIVEPDPPASVIEELLKIADQGKKEPSAALPAFVTEVIHEKELMSKYAPDYDYADLLERYPLPKPKRAAESTVPSGSETPRAYRFTRASTYGPSGTMATRAPGARPSRTPFTAACQVA